MQLTKKKTAILALALIFCIGIASAAVLEYFGRIVTTVYVKQAVLLDGKDITEMPITEEATVAGGESFCRYHWLTSQTSVPVNLALVTDITYDGGITVEYYKFGELTLGASDFAYRDPAVEYVSKVVVSHGEGCAVWAIDLNGSLISGHWSTGAQLLIATPEVIYTFGISPGAASQPVYKEYNGGAWSSPLPVPEGMTAEGNVNDEHFVLKIPLKYLCGAKWAINIEASWAGHSGSYYAQYPKGWGRWSNPTAGVADLLTPIGSQFTLAPGERLDFIICYKFATNIKPDIYTITTTVKLAPE
jgi:hypothetical protein